MDRILIVDDEFGLNTMTSIAGKGTVRPTGSLTSSAPELGCQSVAERVFQLDYEVRYTQWASNTHRQLIRSATLRSGMTKGKGGVSWRIG
jgi:hypothetical protein